MINRRQLLTTSGLLGALTPAAGEDAPYGAGQQLSPQAAQEIVAALKDIKLAIAAPASFAEIQAVRSRQVDFLKARGKFPDFIDVGADVWYGVHDWHVRLQQPLTVARDAAGRYTLMLGFTALILRPEAVANFISPPYDN